MNPAPPVTKILTAVESLKLLLALALARLVLLPAGYFITRYDRTPERFAVSELAFPSVDR